MDYVTSILDVYDRADATARADGRSWYPAMRRIMKEHSRETGLTVRQCAAVYAANSINTPWQRNLSLAARALADGGMVGGTLGMVVAKVNAIMAGADIETTLTADPDNLKIVNFHRNLAGDYQSVTVDRWAYRIATSFADCKNAGASPCESNGRHGCGIVPTGNLYREMADAYRTAAAMRGVNPATMQATTWVVVRGTAE